MSSSSMAGRKKQRNGPGARRYPWNNGYEMRQRMIGGGRPWWPILLIRKKPDLAEKLNQSGVATLAIDVDAVRGNAGRFLYAVLS